MKRFVVIITSLLIIFVFVALNYLLWDRESLVTLRESNQASIDALSRINMSLGEEKTRLEEKNRTLTEQVKELERKIEELEANIEAQQGEFDSKAEFLLAMKKQLNPLPVRTAALEWIDLLYQKSYSSAFMAGESNCMYWGKAWNLRHFTEYFEKNIEKIELMLVGEEQQPVIEVVPSSTPDWNVNVSVHIQAELKENADDSLLKPGENVLNLIYTYNERVEKWLIISVTSEAVEAEEPPEEEIGSKQEESEDSGK